MVNTEEALAHKKKVHAGHRSSATRLAGQFEALIVNPVTNTDELALLQTSLFSKLTVLAMLDTKIIEVTPEEQLEQEIGGADQCTERIWKMMLKISKALKTLATPTSGPSSLRPRTTPRNETHPDPGDVDLLIIEAGTPSRDKTSLDHIHDGHISCAILDITT